MAATLTEQLRQAEVELADFTDKLQQAKRAIAHIEPFLKMKTKQFGETENLLKKDNAEIKVKEIFLCIATLCISIFLEFQRENISNIRSLLIINCSRIFTIVVSYL